MMRVKLEAAKSGPHPIYQDIISTMFPASTPSSPHLSTTTALGWKVSGEVKEGLEKSADDHAMVIDG